MKRSALCMVFAVICCLNTLPHAAQAVDRNEIVRQARQSYYSLKDEGVSEFGCRVQVDWNSFYKSPGFKPDALARDQLLPIMEKTHFQVLVDVSGAPKVSHHSEVVPPNEAVAARVRQMTVGLEELLTGFLLTWSNFTISPPLPYPHSDFQLENHGDKYHITYNIGSNHVVLSMTHNFAIDEMSATGPTIETTVRPTFARLKNRFVLAGFESEQSPKGQSGVPQQFSVQIGYREIEGLELPSTMNVVGPLPDNPEVHLVFTDCQSDKHVNLAAADKASDDYPANISSVPNAADPGKTIPESGPNLAQPGIPPPGTSENNSGGTSNLEVLSDTSGVDFGPYLSLVVRAVRMNWYQLIPEEARAPHLKKGKVSIQFAILRDGRIAGMKLTGESGDIALDRAAWGGITASAPFQPLPSEFHRPYLALRFHFYYNPVPGDSEQVRLSEILIRTPQPYVQTQVTQAQRKANNLREVIRRGNSFAEEAKANSQGPTAAVGGELGCFSHGQLSEPLEQLVFSLTVGEVSEVVRTKQGFTILQVTNRGEHPCADWSY